MTYPIVLAHGIARFDKLMAMVRGHDNQEDDSRHYFKGIRSALRRDGFTVYHSSVDWAGSVKKRASDLKKNIEDVLQRENRDKVHIIAHSVGGLDARHMLFQYRHLNMHRKVASVTTIGTPHLGTTIADWGVARFQNVIEVFENLGLDLNGFRDLTTTACAKFNSVAAQFERNCGVLFQTIAGTQRPEFIFPPLRPSYFLIYRNEGPNDGLVSLRSASWKRRYFHKRVNADHLNELGWWEPGDGILARLPGKLSRGETPRQLEARIRGLYVQVARRLRGRNREDRGFQMTEGVAKLTI